MRWFNNRNIALVVAWLLFFSLHAQADMSKEQITKALMIFTEEYPPITFTNPDTKQADGLGTEVVLEIMQRLGIQKMMHFGALH